MKSVEDVTACVVDYGNTISLADKLGEQMEKVYYYSPCEKEEYQAAGDCVIGSGLKNAERIDDFFAPEIFDTIDLFVFPDIGWGGLQKHLRNLGKAVWGAMGFDDLELYRGHFLDVLKAVGLPIIQSKKITGLTNLIEHLKKNDDKWVKIERYRRNMETWHHLDMEHSARMLDILAVMFGGVKDSLQFIVQDNLKSELEIGYDGWCIDGEFPPTSYQGYEGKDELYLGSLLPDADLPEEVRLVNSKMAPLMREYGYRNWWATEIRIVKGVPYFIDPTARMPGLTGEHQQETCLNLGDVIWHGANGEMIEPEWLCKFAAEATLHYDLKASTVSTAHEWKSLRFPKKVERWLKLANYCIIDGVYQFRPHRTNEIGPVIGIGDSVEESIEHLMENVALLKHLPVSANTDGFAELLKTIQEAEDEGLKFGGRIPKPEMILEKD